MKLNRLKKWATTSLFVNTRKKGLISFTMKMVTKPTAFINQVIAASIVEWLTKFQISSAMTLTVFTSQVIAV